MRNPYQVRDARPPSSQRVVCFCVHWGNRATKEALFNAEGIAIIEKYCDGCLETEKFSAIMTFYTRNGY